MSIDIKNSNIFDYDLFDKIFDIQTQLLIDRQILLNISIEKLLIHEVIDHKIKLSVLNGKIELLKSLIE